MKKRGSCDYMSFRGWETSLYTCIYEKEEQKPLQAKSVMMGLSFDIAWLSHIR